MLIKPHWQAYIECLCFPVAIGCVRVLRRGGIKVQQQHQLTRCVSVCQTSRQRLHGPTDK